MYSDEMWQIINESVNPTNSKIICPITGGLDSRVIAYILSQKGFEVISYYIYTEKTKRNFPHIEAILKLCNVKKHYWIYAEEVSQRRQTARKFMAKRYNLSEYDFYTPAYNNVVTGGIKRRKDNRIYWFNKKINNPYRAKYYKNIVDPTRYIKWVAYCYSLPFAQRIMQRGFINMIKKNTPLGHIPRCFDDGTAPMELNSLYYIKFIIRKIKQKMSVANAAD